jgi:hypothetical protein
MHPLLQRSANICSRLTFSRVHVMSFGIKCLCAEAIKRRRTKVSKSKQFRTRPYCCRLLSQPQPGPRECRLFCLWPSRRVPGRTVRTTHRYRRCWSSFAGPVIPMTVWWPAPSIVELTSVRKGHVDLGAATLERRPTKVKSVA